jgi:pantetheine-phosphate adenylyltransferase
MKVCIGGTFDILHKGHKKIIDKAFDIAGKQGSVFIGITSDFMTKKKGDTKPLIERRKSIEQYLIKKNYYNRAIIKKINDKFGPTMKEDFDVIVVSPETKPTANEINNRRIFYGKKPIKIVQIPYVFSEDKIHLSSSRIKKGEIDENGKILS